MCEEKRRRLLVYDEALNALAKIINNLRQKIYIELVYTDSVVEIAASHSWTQDPAFPSLPPQSYSVVRATSSTAHASTSTRPSSIQPDRSPTNDNNLLILLTKTTLNCILAAGLLTAWTYSPEGLQPLRD